MKELNIKITIPALLILVLIVIFLIFKKTSFFQKSEPEILTSATLEDAVNISSLSTAQFTYNGIAEIYDNDDKNSVKCYVRYHAKVKAGIDMEDVVFHIDNEKKTVQPILPKIDVTSNTVDENSLSYIPDNTKIDLKEALTACQKDALSEAERSPQLIQSAQENLRSIIEALILPIISSQAYTIQWDE